VRQATHVPRYRPALTPAEWDLPFESLTIRTADDVRLAGWLVIPPSPRGIVVVQHGYGTCRADPLQLTALVVRGGYAAVSVDFRGHGESGGTCSFGKQERLDVRAAIDAALAHPRLHGLPVAYLGISLGGAIGILTAAEEPRIQALISDSSYAWLAPMVGRYQRVAYGLPEVPWGWITAACLAVGLGTTLSALDPVRAVGRVRCPILIIHGEEDMSIPVSHAQALYQAARPPKELWIVPGAGHVASVYQADTEYARRVIAFLDRTLSHAARPA